MKTTLIVLITCIGFLNAAISATTITALNPIPVSGVKTNVQVTFTAGAFSTETEIFVYTGDTIPTTNEVCKINPASTTATTAMCEMTIATKGTYNVALGNTAQTTLGTIEVKDKVISKVSPNKDVEKGKDVKITLTTASTFASEKIQFTTADFTTSATDPTAATCEKGGDNKSTVCTQNFADKGTYKVFIDRRYDGFTVEVSGRFFSLAFGILATLFLF